MLAVWILAWTLLLPVTFPGFSAAHAASPKILVFGDSLSAAYGIGAKEGWVTLLADRLKRNGLDYSVANASISGETSAGGASRIARLLAEEKPAVVVLALGANDGLRGLPLAQMRDNLSAIVTRSQQAGARVLVVGMQMPPNYGPKYTREFQESFAEIAKRHRTAYVPFLLEGIADRDEMFLSDRLHPTAAAQPRLLENVWKGLSPLLRPGGSRPAVKPAAGAGA